MYVYTIRILLGMVEARSVNVKTTTTTTTTTHVCMYVCMYGNTYSKSMDQPGKVANPARGQLNRKNDNFLSAFVPENFVS